MMKKALIILLTVVFSLGLFIGCAGNETGSVETTTENIDAGSPTEASENDSDPFVYDINTTIMGEQETSKEKMIHYYNVQTAYYRAKFPQFYIDRNVTLDDFAQMYIDEAKAEGVRPEVAFAQMMHETDFLRFTGRIAITQMNFAGMGATDDGAAGADFSVYGDNETGIRMGIRAQIQHLKAYASDENLVNECVDPRFDILEAAGGRNSAPLIGQLGCGKWASDKAYAERLILLLNGMQ